MLLGVEAVAWLTLLLYYGYDTRDVRHLGLGGYHERLARRRRYSTLARSFGGRIGRSGINYAKQESVGAA